MKDDLGKVNGKVVDFFVRMCERYGEAIPRFFENSGIDPEESLEWIDWPAFLVLMRRLRIAAGSDDQMRKCGEEILSVPSLEIVTLPMRLVLSPRTLFWASHQWAGPSVFPGLDKDFSERKDGTLVLTIGIPEHREDSDEFFLLTQGMFSSLPRLMGMPFAVVDLEREGRRGHFLVTLPPSSTMFARLRRALTVLFSTDAERDPAMTAFNRLAESHEELQNRFTELQRAERNAQRAREAAETARRLAEAGLHARDELVRSMSHELRTPLVGILGACDVLDDRGHADVAELSTNIRQSGSRLLEHVERISEFHKLQAGAFELESGSFNPKTLLQSVISAFEAQARSLDATIDADVGEGLPERLSGDEDRIRQVLSSLTDNALARSSGGQIVLGVNADGPDVLFRVRDAGTGIPPGQEDALFNPFHKVADELAKSGSGLGLGLAVCKALVELHGGSIEARNHPGGGAEFSFRLPPGLQ